MRENRDEKKGETRKRKEDKYYGVYFLLFVIILYIILLMFEPENVLRSLKASGVLFIQILPVLLFVILFMGIMNYFVTPKAASKYIGKGSGIKGWLLAVSAGILSHGPIYVWFPLLKELRNKGMSDSLIAVFLYNRAIKLPLLPLMVYYFGILFVVVLLIYMIIASIVEGKIIEMTESKASQQAGV